MSALQELQERRAHELRLTPDRALGSVEEAESFVRERGLVTRTPDSALPSLYEACHEDPYKPGAGGFGEWPATKYPWFGELEARPGLYRLKIHRGKNVLVTAAVAALVDPICRSELTRMEGTDDDWARLLGHLASVGPSELEDLKTELELKPKELKQILSPLERCGAVVGRQVVHRTAAGGHLHTSEFARWDQVFPDPLSGDGGLDDLVVAGVRAAVVAPEREVPRKWFSWSWLFEPDLVDRLVAEGRLKRPEPGWLSGP